jgi:uncharacterized protein (TIGR00106 family)
MPHVILELHIVPIGTASTSVGSYVAAAERVLRQHPNIQHELHPMSSTLEGELDEIWPVIRQMQEAVFSAGAVRVSTSIRIDDRRDTAGRSMGDKVKSVEEKL